jgi:hypothetical protein
MEPNLRTPAQRCQRVVDPADWTGAEMERRTDWLVELSERQRADLAAMAGTVCSRIGGDPNGLLETTADDFDLGAFAPVVSVVEEALRNGRGFMLLRGLPVDALGLPELAAIYWGIGRHLGRAISNNADGDMIGHVTDLGGDPAGPNQRGYQTSAELGFHQDQCDVVALLCLRTAQGGGRSMIASSIAVHNEIVRRRPDLAEVLAQPVCFSRHGEIGPGQRPWYAAPVFNYTDGFLSVTAGRAHIDKGHALPDAPDMTARQDEALTLVETVARELHLSMAFRPGDIQILNNHVILHNRTAYQDWPEAHRRRILWRLWLSVPDIRPRTPWFETWRDGVRVAATTDRIVL